MCHIVQLSLYSEMNVVVFIFGFKSTVAQSGLENAGVLFIFYCFHNNVLLLYTFVYAPEMSQSVIMS